MRYFGLIGYPLGHSFSKSYFTAFFENNNIDASYDLYPIETSTNYRNYYKPLN